MSTNADHANHNSPETPVDKLRDVVAGLIDAVATQGGKAIDTLGLRTGARSSIPSVDVTETNEDVLVVVDLPGVDPKHVEILLTGNMLTVKGEQPAAETEPHPTVHRRERPIGPFCRSIPLPVAVNSEQVSAESRHGVLTIRVAKAERLKSRQIPIEVRST
jgi:HSP20 family protein